MLSRSSEIAVKKLLFQSKPLFLGVFNGVPDTYGEGVPEVSYTGYARQAIAFSGAVGVEPLGNSNVIEIPRPPENFKPVSITHVGIYDAVTGGGLVAFATLVRSGKPASQPLSHDATAKLGVNAVTFDLVNVPNGVSCTG